MYLPTRSASSLLVGKYMIRPILSLKRLSFDESEGQILYQYGKSSLKSERTDYLEFIARVTPRIPDKGQVMTRYYGLYSNAHRGKKRKADGGRPSGDGLQEQLPNRPELHM